MKKALTLALIALFVTSVAHAEDWLLLKEGEGVATVYVDKDSYEEKDGLRFFWLRSVMKYPERRRKKDQKREVRLFHAVDCMAKEVYPPVHMKMFRGDGKLLDEVEQDFEKIKSGKRDIMELSAGDKVFEAVCGKKASATPDETPAQN